MKNKKLFLGFLLCSIGFLYGQDQATNYGNISLGGWLLVNSNGTSDGINNGIFFGTSYAWNASVGIFSNKLSNGYGPRDGLNFMTGNGIRMVINQNGQVGIGTANPTSLLSVNGTILTKDIEVSTRYSDWPDYVFEKEYKLPSLDDLKKYVKTHKHLPYMTSKEEVGRAEKYNLNNTTVNLLRTVEELTLHILELNDKVKELERKVNKKTE